MIFGYIKEIFFSYQGEGIYYLQPQIFVRFCGCNLECDYCDEAEIIKLNERYKRNLYSVLNRIKNLSKKHKTKTICITGGEPLLQLEFLLDLLKNLKKNNYKTYLETNASLIENFKYVIKYIDVISVDFKFPSSCKNDLFSKHKEFLKLCKKFKKDFFVKFILTNKTKDYEIKKSVNIIKSIDRKIKVVLQPVTPIRNIFLPKPIKIFLWFDYIKKKLYNIYLIPQLHKLVWRIK